MVWFRNTSLTSWCLKVSFMVFLYLGFHRNYHVDFGVAPVATLIDIQQNIICNINMYFNREILWPPGCLWEVSLF